MKSSSTSAALTHEAGLQHLMLMMNEHLSELSEYVRHALATAEAAGELTPDELTTGDVVDHVILRAYREFARKPGRQPVGDRLRQLAKERIRSEIGRRRWEREHLSPEQRELRRCVGLALAELPQLWRRVLVLRHVQRLTSGRVARALHLPEAEVSRTAAHALAFLRQRLLESGWRVGAGSRTS